MAFADFLQVLGTPLMFLVRGRLAFRLDGNRTREVVSWLSANGQTTAYFVRIRVVNKGFLTADDAVVSVYEIRHNGQVVDADSSALAWTDVHDVQSRYSGQSIAKAPEIAPYVDVCGVDRLSGDFHVFSKKHTFGYHQFKQDGEYQLELVVRGARPTQGHALTIVLNYRRGNDPIVLNTELRSVSALY